MLPQCFSANNIIRRVYEDSYNYSTKLEHFVTYTSPVFSWLSLLSVAVCIPLGSEMCCQPEQEAQQEGCKIK